MWITSVFSKPRSRRDAERMTKFLSVIANVYFTSSLRTNEMSEGMAIYFILLFFYEFVNISAYLDCENSINILKFLSNKLLTFFK